MSANQKQTAMQSQKLMIFVLSMSLYGLATLFTELIPKFQVGLGVFRGIFSFHPAGSGYAL